MIDIQVDTNATEVARWLQAFHSRQLPFATSLAINRTAKEAQRAVRNRMENEFTLRRARWFKAAVKIKPFSTKRSLAAQILIDPPGGQSRADIITRHEERGRRHPLEGQSLAVPIEARPSERRQVPKKLRIRNLEFRLLGRSGQWTVYQGEQRTFMIRRADGSGYVFQRRGRRRRRRASAGSGRGRWENVRMLYALKPSTPIEPRLGFVDTITRIVNQRFPKHFEEAFERAVRTAR